MARPARHVAAGAFYHGMARGVDGQLIYRIDADFELFIQLLRIVERRFGWVIHAYCLMPNHYHLVVETPLPNLPAGMQYLNGVYAQGFNGRYGRVGHLFQARYEARVLEGDEYARIATRYVLDNPVKAGLCEKASDWPFSWCALGRTL
jgi:REP-associated tyrosine transposase